MVRIYGYVYVLVLIFAVSAWAHAQDGSVQQKGIEIFVEHRCYTCHTIKAEADAIQKEKEAFAKSKGVELKDSEEEKEDKGIAPDLSDIGKKRDAESLESFLKDPKKSFKDTPECQSNAKKKYRKRFKGTPDEFEALIAYLSSLKYDSYNKDFVSCLKKEE
jgi:cbb3-type cytochrome oxidase cytochrome c subunit